MQSYQLSIRANKRPETLERLLRVIRHRGFEVLTLNTDNQDNQINFQATVQSKRDIHLLLNQLAKLPDVLELK